MFPIICHIWWDFLLSYSTSSRYHLNHPLQQLVFLSMHDNSSIKKKWGEGGTKRKWSVFWLLTEWKWWWWSLLWLMKTRLLWLSISRPYINGPISIARPYVNGTILLDVYISSLPVDSTSFPVNSIQCVHPWPWYSIVVYTVNDCHFTLVYDYLG